MKNNLFDQAYAIMKASFPESERRTYDGQKALLSDPHYRLEAETDSNDRLISFIAAWEFPSLRFVEHLAVDPDIRGGGIGGKMMRAYMGECSTPVVLEVEPPDTQIAIRRVSFYKRLGFHLNPFDYRQPPLQQGHSDLPLKLMSYPSPLKEFEFVRYREILYNLVYKVKPLKKGE
ncbi:GNAT family N-acetyltransferase [Cohnella yongneupensis]|uniref:GNAT family N-acetyltransferase n=1 Tax=Cohnella yongneupensis TaxID=425006 RepID=A0ABW0R1J1_9BACL